MKGGCIDKYFYIFIIQDLDNKWIGVQNIALYKFDTDYFFFKPKLEANFTYLMQDSIKEDRNYGLEIEKSEK